MKEFQKNGIRLQWKQRISFGGTGSPHIETAFAGTLQSKDSRLKDKSSHFDLKS